jgi:hypothetical protein
MTRLQQLVAVALLPAVLACSALGVCWMTFAADAGHGCCEPATTASLDAGGPGSCASLVVAATVPVVPAPEAWAARPPAVAARVEGSVPLARVRASKAPPLVLRI